MTRSLLPSTRGQAHTLEAVAAATILLASIVFALQVTAVTPLTASTSSQHIENQQGATAEGVLAAAARSGSLRDSILIFNETSGDFYNTTDEGTYAVGGPRTEFGQLLNRTFRERGIAFNVNLYYLQADGSRSLRRMVYFGAPSDHATVARRSVTLRDDQTLLTWDLESRDAQISEVPYFAPDADPDSGLYNVVIVEVVVWRM